MDKSRQYFKTWHLTHEDHCDVWLETESQNFQMKWRQARLWSGERLVSRWAVHTPAWDDARLCHLAKIPCNFAHIGVMRIFLAPNILPAFSLIVDWLMYQWCLCTERWQWEKQRILFIWLCSALTLFFIMSKATMFEALLLWESCDTFTIFLVNSPLSHLRASLFIYLFI